MFCGYGHISAFSTCGFIMRWYICETIKQVEKFKYLGSTITSDGRNDAEIKNTNRHGKGCLPKDGECNQKQEHNDRNKEQNPAVLSYSHPYLWQRVLDNITKHGKKVGSHRNVVSQKNATHILEEPCHK